MDSNRLKEILAPMLEQNKKIVSIESSELPQMGVNSVMIKVKVTLQDGKDRNEQLYLVAKTISNAKIKNFEDRGSDFYNTEVKFYEDIVPILKELEQEEGIKDGLDIFAKFYGTRYIKGVDDFAVLLFEDLTVKGFSNGDRKTGLDLKHAEQILSDLAKFHGTSIALKIKKPDLFEKKITPLCANFSFSDFKEIIEPICKSLSKIIESFPEYSHLADRLSNFPGVRCPAARDPFATIIHFDFWVNNIMSTVEEDGTIRNVFVDFQVFDYNSAASDVFFFLWTSVNPNILKDKIDHLLQVYHQRLINTLNDFKIATNNFVYDKFEEELRYQSNKFEFGHAMLFKSFLLKETFENFKPELDEVSSELKEFIKFMLSECLKRRWIY